MDGKRDAESPIGDADSVIEIFRQFDENGDGYIGRDELDNLLSSLDPKTWSSRRVSRLLAKVDLSGDGRIELDEFLEWVFGREAAYCPHKRAFAQTIGNATQNMGQLAMTHAMTLPANTPSTVLVQPPRKSNSVDLDPPPVRLPQAAVVPVAENNAKRRSQGSLASTRSNVAAGRSGRSTSTDYVSALIQDLDPRTQQLDFPGDPPLTSRGFRRLAADLPRSPYIMSLRFADLKEDVLLRATGAGDLRCLFSRLPGLRRLSLTGCGLTPAAVRVVGEAIIAIKLNGVEILDLDLSRNPACAARPERLRQLLEPMSQLTTLRLHACGLSIGSLNALAQGLSETLLRLELDGNPGILNAEPEARALTRIGIKCSEIIVLTLHGCCMDTGAAPCCLFAIAQNFPKLEMLDLGMNGIEAIGLRTLAQRLRGNSALAHVDLTGNPGMLQEGEGVDALVDMLGKCLFVRKLLIWDSGLTPRGLETFAEAVKDCVRHPRNAVMQRLEILGLAMPTDRFFCEEESNPERATPATLGACEVLLSALPCLQDIRVPVGDGQWKKLKERLGLDPFGQPTVNQT